MQHSNCPHVYLDPNTNTTGSFKCPFISPFSWVDLTDNSTKVTSGLGVLNFDVLAALRIFQGGTPAPVYVQVYGWIEDLELAYPTTEPLATFVAQGGDEYEVQPGAGVISGPAAAVASVAGRLRDAPFIGKFALATEIGAKAVSAVARLFGFSRPSMLVASADMRQNLVTDMVHTDVPDGSTSLTVNAKHELSIDPHTIGFDSSEDDLTVKNLACRWTLGQIWTWTRADPIDATLVNADVWPFMFSVPGDASNPYRLTSLGLCAMLFEYWHGTIEVRIKIVASRMHRGRLRLQWTPDQSANDLNLSYNHIIDISGMREYCVSLPFVATTGFLRSMGHPDSSTFYRRHSGVFRIIVQNQLVCPTDEPVSILLSVRGADDIRFTVPAEIKTLSHHANGTLAEGFMEGGLPEIPEDLELEQQGGEMVELGQAAAVDCVDLAFVPSKYLPDLDMIYFGDPVRSFRALMKRYTYVTTVMTQFDHGASGFKQYSLWLSLYPAAYGMSGQGSWNRAVGGGRIFMVNSTLANVLEPCYLGKKGSFRHIVDFSGGDLTWGSNVVVQRRDGHQLHYYPNVQNLGTPSGPELTRETLAHNASGWRGLQVLPIADHCQRVHVELPFYSPLKYTPVFDFTDLTRSYDAGNRAVRLFRSSFRASILFQSPHDDTARPTAQIYSAAGEDFTMFFFRGVPLLYALAGAGYPQVTNVWAPPL